jgi:GNAT superfamily N-acetyltransferase
MSNARFRLRPIAPADDAAVAHIIRTVMPEFGADGPGFAINDAEVSAMTDAYRGPRAVYLVVVDQSGRVVGGGGIAPLEGGDDDTCELKKMYFLPETRGHGVGRALLTRLLDEAKDRGFTRCYLETLRRMDAAVALYGKLGFVEESAPCGSTGHFSCDRYFTKTL